MKGFIAPVTTEQLEAARQLKEEDRRLVQALREEKREAEAKLRAKFEPLREDFNRRDNLFWTKLLSSHNLPLDADVTIDMLTGELKYVDRENSQPDAAEIMKALQQLLGPQEFPGVKQEIVPEVKH